MDLIEIVRDGGQSKRSNEVFSDGEDEELNLISVVMKYAHEYGADFFYLHY